MSRRRLIHRPGLLAALIIGSLLFGLVATPPQIALANELPFHYLPWASGVTRFVTQGNNSAPTHTGIANYA
jgi:hypothetical protein